MTVTHLSGRGEPLLWQGQCVVPVITLENYEKWYHIYVVHPDGTVEPVPSSLLTKIVDDGHGILWQDHFFHPELLLLVAQHYKGEAHTTAVEIAAGRWMLNDTSVSVPFRYRLDD